MSNKARTIAIYLPQFHPFKENDEWWGKGFTEWTNVSKARPRFLGHYQPHIPADLGFYDLRLEETRVAQAEMAQKYGIYGFCYYHYWFNGHQLMERPLKEVISSGKPDFPFMLCWANENWTKAWDGKENNILISQNYSDDDDKKHIIYLLENVFSDPRYIRVEGKPVFCIYKSQLFPNMERTIKIWREIALQYNEELYLCRMEIPSYSGSNYLKCGFDAAIEFQPYWGCVSLQENFFSRILNKCSRTIISKDIVPIAYDYGKFVEKMCERKTVDYKLFPCVTPSWDNSPRRKNNFFAFKNSTPQKYQFWLENVLGKFVPYSKDENFIFINAWNEWAEGNHLEPDQKWGLKYLEATKAALHKYEL